MEEAPKLLPGESAGIRRTLFEITEDIMRFGDILIESGGDITDPEVEAELTKVMALYETSKSEFYHKIDSYGALIQEFEARGFVLKGEAERLAKLGRSYDGAADRLRNNLCYRLKDMGLTRIATDRFKITVQTNGGKQPITVDEKVIEKLKPIELRRFCKPEYKVIMDNVREHLLAGKKLPWARIAERGSHLKIR